MRTTAFEKKYKRPQATLNAPSVVEIAMPTKLIHVANHIFSLALY